jgi:hypothetical protein
VFLSFFFLQLRTLLIGKSPDLAYMSLGIAFMTVVSILVVWKMWRRVLMNPPVGYTRSAPEIRDRPLLAVGRRAMAARVHDWRHS